MEKLKFKFSILVCAYSNGYQFNNFLYTACMQDLENYEIIIVDNGTANNEIYWAWQKAIFRHKIHYHFISPEEKKCRNITQGINKAASMASGEYLVIVADSNVLLSFNLLSKINELIDKNTLVLSAGKYNDVKISPNGNYANEYEKSNQYDMQDICAKILHDMGWPDDPLNLKLLDGKHRYPDPHENYDCYIVAMAQKDFFAIGGYNEDETQWGDYHSNFVKKCARILITKKLEGIKIVHQYHRVFKQEQAEVS